MEMSRKFMVLTLLLCTTVAIVCAQVENDQAIDDTQVSPSQPFDTFVYRAWNSSNVTITLRCKSNTPYTK